MCYSGVTRFASWDGIEVKVKVLRVGEVDAGRDSMGNGEYVWFGNMVDLDSLTGNGTWAATGTSTLYFCTFNFGTTLVT